MGVNKRLEAVDMPLGGHRMKRAGNEQQIPIERGRLPIAGNEGDNKQEPSAGQPGVAKGMVGFYGGMTQGVANVVKNNTEKKKEDMVDMTEFI
jgi:hypothetical protein